jgi:hypothetical protein
LAASSRSSLRAEDVHNKIANKNQKKQEAVMHDAGERLQLIALSVDPRKEGLARHAQRSIALEAA